MSRLKPCVGTPFPIIRYIGGIFLYNMEQELITRKELQLLLNKSKSTIRKYIKRGFIKPCKIIPPNKQFFLKTDALNIKIVRKTRIYKKTRKSEIDKLNGYKICSCCHSKKELNDFLYYNKNYYKTCKKCFYDYRNSKRIKKPRKERKDKKGDRLKIDILNGFIVCRGCNENKPLNKFWLNKKLQAYDRRCYHCKNSKARAKAEENRKTYKPNYENNTQKCKKCQEYKELKNFRFTKINDKKYYKKQCMECEAKQRKFFNIERHKKLIELNTFLICRKCKISRLASNFNAGCYYECRICASKLRRENYKLNKQHYLELKRKKWESKEWREKRAEFRRNKYKNNPHFKLRLNISVRIRDSIKNSKNYKTGKTKDLIGCDYNFLKNYIESKFKDGMNWDSFLKGEIEIDHILPCCLFDLSDPKQQKICFNYKNLQPLWRTENSKKSDFLPSGKRVRNLTKQEKLDYLKSLGFDLS